MQYVYRYKYSFIIVPLPDISILPVGTIIDGIVGNPQEIHCTVSTVNGVELSSVMISWMGPGGDTIRNDSRVTISQIIQVNNDYVSTLEFAYLMEGDEGIYTCDTMILGTEASSTSEIKNLTSKLWITDFYALKRNLMVFKFRLPIYNIHFYYRSAKCLWCKFDCASYSVSWSATNTGV